MIAPENVPHLPEPPRRVPTGALMLAGIALAGLAALVARGWWA